MWRTRRVRTSGTKGFLMKSMAPRESPFTSVSSFSSEVRKMTGTCLPFSVARRALRVSNPSMPGILISSRIRSGTSRSRIYSRSARPDFIAVTRIFARLKMRPAILRLASSSSTTITQSAIV